MQMVAKEGVGVILYMRQEGRGIGLGNKVRAYALQDSGVDTYEANHQLGFHDDERDYSMAVSILKYFGVKSLLLITNNPEKIRDVIGKGGAMIKQIREEAERDLAEIFPYAVQISLKVKIDPHWKKNDNLLKRLIQ